MLLFFNSCYIFPAAGIDAYLFADLDKRRNLYLETEASGAATAGTPGEDNVGTIAQGFLEMSNVEIVEEMVNLITAQRAYEINSKMISASDEMLQTTNNLKR